MYLPFLQFFKKVSLLHYCIILIWGEKEEGQLFTLVHGSLNQEEQQGEYMSRDIQSPDSGLLSPVPGSFKYLGER